MDNFYSHRSTQKYKRKPFVSHYFDCRLKGRPPGTKPSEDPGKQKRKRKARERDLCDVKIKITEYFPGARQILGEELAQSLGIMTANTENSARQNPGSATPSNLTMLDSNISATRHETPGSNGARFYAIQRVNGNGQNGKGDGTAATHQHSIDESDRIKKSSVYRHFLKEEKESRRSQVSSTCLRNA